MQSWGILSRPRRESHIPQLWDRVSPGIGHIDELQMSIYPSALITVCTNIISRCSDGLFLVVATRVTNPNIAPMHLVLRSETRLYIYKAGLRGDQILVEPWCKSVVHQQNLWKGIEDNQFHIYNSGLLLGRAEQHFATAHISRIFMYRYFLIPFRAFDLCYHCYQLCMLCVLAFIFWSVTK